MIIDDKQLLLMILNQKCTVFLHFSFLFFLPMVSIFWMWVTALFGMALGFAYFVVDNAALAMASFGGYPPLLAAWAPFFLFLLIGETVLIRTEE